MLYGLYQSAVGADLQALKMDTVSNNIANASTSSFKRDLAVFGVRQQQAQLDGNPHGIPQGLENHPGSAIAVETFTDHSQGPLKNTGSSMDAALAGPGFFRVTDGQSDFVTRRGSFTLNADSDLVEVDSGFHVLDDLGNPITVPPGSELQISQAGYLTAIDPLTNLPIPLGRLDVVEPTDYRLLQKQGDSHYSIDESALQPAGPETRVRQGYQEGSGVQPVKEMLEMIQTSRGFEANMNLIQHQDNSLGQLLQAIGKN